jgi:hypothetical protein
MKMKNKRGRKWWHVIRWRNKIKKEDGEGRRANAKEGRKGGRGKWKFT